MKKALVLGVLAFFAINVASVQSASAQNKKTVKTEKASAKAEKAAVKADKPSTKAVRTSNAPAAKVTTTSTTEAGKEKVVKPATAAPTQNEAKACCKEDGKKECPAPKTAVKVDPTAKNKTPEVGVPPTQNKTKNKTTSNTATTKTGTTK